MFTKDKWKVRPMHRRAYLNFPKSRYKTDVSPQLLYNMYENTLHIDLTMRKYLWSRYIKFTVTQWDSIQKMQPANQFFIMLSILRLWYHPVYTVRFLNIYTSIQICLGDWNLKKIVNSQYGRLFAILTTLLFFPCVPTLKIWNHKWELVLCTGHRSV